jgi:hypothetical protein
MRKQHKYISITILLLIGLKCSPGLAQNGFWIGATAGVQNTMLSSKSRSEIDTKNAFRPLLSADVAYRFSPRFEIQSGIGYALYTQNTSEFKNNFSYLTVPLRFKVGRFKKDRKYALSYFGGVDYKFLLSAKNSYQGEINDISDYTRNFHLDYTFGIGIKFKIQKKLILESHLMGTIGDGSFNRVSFDGFYLTNINYGVAVGLKYQIKRNK